LKFLFNDRPHVLNWIRYCAGQSKVWIPSLAFHTNAQASADIFFFRNHVFLVKNIESNTGVSRTK